MTVSRALTALCLLPAGAAALLAAATAMAAESAISTRVISAGEFAVLPEWCIDSQAGPYGGPNGATGLNNSPNAAKWVAAMGTDFWHMHHYCYALRDLHRLQRADLTPGDRKFLAIRAGGDLGYVISNCSPTMPLLPEVYLRQGELALTQGALELARESFEQSRSLRPDYWPAYERWAAVLMDLKRYETARDLVLDGLDQVPGQPNLTGQLKAIDAALRRAGRPVPARKPGSAVAAAASSAAAASAAPAASAASAASAAASAGS